MPFTAPFGLLPCPRSLELKSRTSFGTFAHSLKFKYHRDHRFRTTSNSNPSNQRLVFFHHFWATTNHITSHFVSHTSKPKSSSPSFVQILSDSPPQFKVSPPDNNVRESPLKRAFLQDTLGHFKVSSTKVITAEAWSMIPAWYFLVGRNKSGDH